MSELPLPTPENLNQIRPKLSFHNPFLWFTKSSYLSVANFPGKLFFYNLSKPLKGTCFFKIILDFEVYASAPLSQQYQFRTASAFVNSKSVNIAEYSTTNRCMNILAVQLS